MSQLAIRRLFALLAALAAGAVPLRAALAPCVPDGGTLCVDELPGDQRYELRITYKTAQGGGLAGSGHAVPLAPSGLTRGGAFWFFSPDNPEMLVKLLDGCALNQHHWLLAAATTNVGFTLVARDTLTGAERTYTSADQHPAVPIQDVAAFDCTDPCGNPELAPRIASFTADAASLATGAPQTFRWTVHGAGPFAQSLTGTELANVALRPGDRVYSFAPQVPGAHVATLGVRGRCGSDSREVHYDVQQACAAPRVDSFTTQYANGYSSFCAGQPATLTWQTSGSGDVSISGIGAVAPSGSVTVPANATTTYTLTKTAACGSDSATLGVAVSQPARIVSFTADDSTLPCFGSTTLRFDIEGDGVGWSLMGGSIIRPYSGTGSGPQTFSYQAGGFCQRTVTLYLSAFGACPANDQRSLSIVVN